MSLRTRICIVAFVVAVAANQAFQVNGMHIGLQRQLVNKNNNQELPIINRWRRQAEAAELQGTEDDDSPSLKNDLMVDKYDRQQLVPMSMVWMARPIYNYKRMTGIGGSRGFHGDTFSSGFGDFSTMKRNSEPLKLTPFATYYDNMLENKRITGNGGRGFHGDTFSNGFGDFSTMKRSD